MPLRSFWAWGLQSEEPTDADMLRQAEALSQRFHLPVTPRQIPASADLYLPPPRITPPSNLAEICSSEPHDRAFHSYGRSYPDRVNAFNLRFSNPPDVVARPRNEDDIEALLDWCSRRRYAVVPFGGGSSVVGGVQPPTGYDATVTVDLERMGRVLAVDPTSRSALIQAGALGPGLEAQLRPHGLTLRHFPQSFQFSALGGWIATRSGGHYATNHTHIDDFVQSVRALSPSGVWESRRLPGSGAGPSPDRLLLGSEGALGIITQAWMRLQARPRFRASAGIVFPSFQSGYLAARIIAQAKLWPANLRLLDTGEARDAAGMDGEHALLVVGFESAEVSQGPNMRQAVEIARSCGGFIPDGEILVADGPGGESGHQDPVGRWRDSFVSAPYRDNALIALGLLHDTFETSITWDRWPALDAAVRAAVQDALDRVCGGGEITCRFSHVYPDGPAPYYTFTAMARPGAEIEMWRDVKTAAANAVIKAGGTITHHHAVGRMHRPWYDQQRPNPFAQALRAAKRSLDPNWVLNPGILIDP